MDDGLLLDIIHCTREATLLAPSKVCLAGIIKVTYQWFGICHV